MAGPGEGRPRLTRKLAGFGTTIFTEMTLLAAEAGAVNLAQGFPDFDGPELVKRAACRAVEAGQGQYAPSPGAPALRRAVARARARAAGPDYDPEACVTVGCGATEMVFAALLALCDPGDEVVLFEPYYDSYRAAVALAGATARVVRLAPPHFGFDPAALAAAFGEKTRAVVLNTPHNPTGKVFSRAELEAVAALCRRHDAVCVADEVYEHLVYEGEHLPISALPGMAERTITVSSMSKTFSLTGWRVGWALAPPDLSAALRCVHQFATFAAPTPLQLACAEALEQGEGEIARLRDTLRARRDRLARALADVGLEPYPVAGAYFICAGFGRYPFADDVDFCRFLTREVGVAAIPPSAFCEGKRPVDYARFVFCKRDETLRAAAERLARLPERARSRGAQGGPKPPGE
ncbi:MAG TPA: aminotransferase class I/II-fold pyridoxal phosphate-dependent enzyme [Polyangiaceae bacterium]|nr:aminotransferase class I/II-fold pyridoxal phosphate-dependent enzyme [Polyangiaceae bacterium]